MSIEEIEELLDEKIHKYNKFNENHPMQGISWNKSINKYHMKINNFESYAVNLNTACDKIIKNFDHKNGKKLLNSKDITKNIISTSDKTLKMIIYIYNSKKYYDIQHIINNIGIKQSCIKKKYNLFSNKIKYYLWRKNKYDGYIRRELISHNAVKNIIHSSRIHKVIPLVKLLNINIFNDKILNKEMINIDQIIKVFNKEKYETQKIIGKYRIDLYFPKYNLAIECDEFNHKDRNNNNESRRQKFIEEKLNTTFIRFNPDDTNFNILDVISKIHYHICNN